MITSASMKNNEQFHYSFFLSSLINIAASIWLVIEKFTLSTNS